MSTEKDSLILRHPTDDEWALMPAFDARAFGIAVPMPADELDDFRAQVEPHDALVVVEPGGPGDPLVALSLFYRMQVTVPGGPPVPAAGLSWVSVAPTHRRRGLLRRMLDAMFDRWESEQFPVAILTASEGGIYERFGFGPAAYADRVRVDPATATLRGTPPADSRVRFGTPEQIAERVPELHARWAATRPGAVNRGAATWRSILADRDFRQPDGAGGLHYLLHEDGYASYRMHSRGDHVRAEIDDLCAVTEQAHTDLWRILTSLDLIDEVTGLIPVDDPLPQKLINLRGVEILGRSDRLWLSVLDVVAALPLRRYRGSARFVMAITDGYRDRAGTYLLEITDGQAEVRRTDEEPTVRMDISVLSTLYLGTSAARDFAAADRLWTDRPETLVALNVAFRGFPEPFAGTFF